MTRILDGLCILCGSFLDGVFGPMGGSVTEKRIAVGAVVLFAAML